MEVKLKLEAWDKYEAVYSWNKLHVVGKEYNYDSFRWYFPERDVIKIISNNYDYVLYKHEIPRFGTRLQIYFEKDAKEELEEELTKLMKESINQRILIQMLFEDILIMGDK